MHYWNSESLTHMDEGNPEGQMQAKADFEVSGSSVVVGQNDLSYTLPPGYQILGEGFEYAVGDGPVRFYQPALKAVERIYTSRHGEGPTVTDWCLIPCVIRLAMADLTLVDILDIAPEVPTITWYRDCNLFAPPPVFPEGLDQAGLVRWGRIADCAGDCYGVLRVGSWLLGQVANSNQVFGWNLETEEGYWLAGWDNVPWRLRLGETGISVAEPPEGESSDLEFDAYQHTRTYFNVIASVGSGQALILRERQTVQASVISDINTFTEPREISGGESTATVSDLFRRVWVNASGTDTAIIDPPENSGLYHPFEWNEAAFQCGGLIGEPWSGNALPPLPDHYPARTRAEAAAEMTAALAADLATVTARAKINAMRVVDVEIGLYLVDFSGETPAWPEEPLVVWDGEDWTLGPLLRGQTEYSISETTYGALPVVASEDYPSNYVLDLEETDYHTSSSSDFSTGAGAMIHGYWDAEVPLEVYTRSGITSEDRNNCEGPLGPWLDASTVDSNPSRPVVLTVLKVPIVSRPELPAPAAWHPCKYCTDGMVLIGLPRESLLERLEYLNPGGTPFENQSGGTAGEAIAWNQAISDACTLTCLPLAELQPSWTVAVLDYATPIVKRTAGSGYPVWDSTSGAAITNGVLNAQFVYLVVKDNAGQRLLRVRVRDLMDGETVVEAAGSVRTGLVASGTIVRAANLHDNLLVVNRRLIGLGADGYFEIEVTWDA